MYTNEQIEKIKTEIAELEAVPKIDYNAHLLPKRTVDTMSDVIALSSPDGKMSSRARETASKNIGKRLFGDYTPDIRYPDKVASRLKDLHYAILLIGFVNRGSKKRKYRKIINEILEKVG